MSVDDFREPADEAGPLDALADAFAAAADTLRHYDSLSPEKAFRTVVRLDSAMDAARPFINALKPVLDRAGTATTVMSDIGFLNDRLDEARALITDRRAQIEKRSGLLDEQRRLAAEADELKAAVEELERIDRLIARLPALREQRAAWERRTAELARAATDEEVLLAAAAESVAVLLDRPWTLLNEQAAEVVGRLADLQARIAALEARIEESKAALESREKDLADKERMHSAASERLARMKAEIGTKAEEFRRYMEAERALLEGLGRREGADAPPHADLREKAGRLLEEVAGRLSLIDAVLAEALAAAESDEKRLRRDLRLEDETVGRTADAN